MADGNRALVSNPAWSRFSAFEIFGDHEPVADSRLAVSVRVMPGALSDLVAARAGLAEPLDPDLAQMMVRAGASLIGTGLARFVYCTTQDALAIVDPAALVDSGGALPVYSRMVTAFAARFTLLTGVEVPCDGHIYEFPDPVVLRKAVSALAEATEDATLQRSCQWLGAQKVGREEPFHASMMETVEEQSSLLQAEGIDVEELPAWWWKGLAIRSLAGRVELLEGVPDDDDLAALIEA